MKNTKSSLLSTILGIIIVCGVVVFIFFLVKGTNKEAEVIISGSKIEIKSQFGMTIDINQIADVELVNTVPTIGERVNGAGLGEIKKGDFQVEGLGTCKLYIHSNVGPYIYIKTTENKYIIINFKDSSKTRTVYETLSDTIN